MGFRYNVYVSLLELHQNIQKINSNDWPLFDMFMVFCPSTWFHDFSCSFAWKGCLVAWNLHTSTIHMAAVQLRQHHCAGPRSRDNAAVKALGVLAQGCSGSLTVAHVH